MQTTVTTPEPQQIITHAAITESSDTKRVSFTMSVPEHDEATYWGRFEAFRATANPRNAFYTNGQIREMQALLARQKAQEDAQIVKTGSPAVLMLEQDIKQVRLAQRLVSTAVHPDTGTFIPWAMRFSSFLPMNMPIAFGMLFTAPTPLNTIFFQWLNQTYNASLNYANRNASSNYTMYDIGLSYSIATSSAIAVGLGIRKALAKQIAASSGSRLVCLNAVSSFFAVASSGFLNAYFMRQTEIKTGIDVLDKETGEPLGKSQQCAKVAVLQTAVSRIFLVFTMFVPPAILVGLERARMTPTRTPSKYALEFSLLFLQLYFAVPIGLALFPRVGSIKAADIEPQFQGIKGKNGELITEFAFNKGL